MSKRKRPGSSRPFATCKVVAGAAGAHPPVSAQSGAGIAVKMQPIPHLQVVAGALEALPQHANQPPDVAAVLHSQPQPHLRYSRARWAAAGRLPAAAAKAAATAAAEGLARVRWEGVAGGGPVVRIAARAAAAYSNDAAPS